MEGFVLFILIIIVSQILGAIKQGSRRPPPGGPPTPQQRQRIERRPGLPGTRPADPAQAPGGVDANAADFIPPDVWELITGQPHPSRRREPTPPVLSPPPDGTHRMSVPDEADTDEEEVADEEGVAELYEAERLVRRRARDVDADKAAVLAQQRSVLAERAADKVSKVVSLETTSIPTTERHRRFHERLEQLEVQPVRPRPQSVRQDLARPEDVRRAFILKEVLGPPKALEDDPGDR
jgi:hypothetical protein